MTVWKRMQLLGRGVIASGLANLVFGVGVLMSIPAPHPFMLLGLFAAAVITILVGARHWAVAADTKFIVELLEDNVRDAQNEFSFFKQGLIDFANRTAEPPDTRESPGRWVFNGWHAGEGTVENHRLARRNAETVSPGVVECVLQDAAGMTVGLINAAYYFATCDDSVIDKLAADDWSDGDVEEEILLTMMRVDPKVDLLVTGRRMSDDPRYDNTLTLSVNRHSALLWLMTYRPGFHYNYHGRKLHYRQRNSGPNWSPDDDGAYWIDDEQKLYPDEDGYPAEGVGTPLTLGLFASDGPLPPTRR